MIALLLPLLAQAAAAQSAGKTKADALSPPEIVAAAPASAWTSIAERDLLVMDLAPDAKGRARRVVIQLMPAPFSQGWIGNIRTLAAAHWWDGTSVNRVQDNYVVQWGDASEKKALPPGLNVIPESAYQTDPIAVLAKMAVSQTATHDERAMWQSYATLCHFNASKIPAVPCPAIDGAGSHSGRTYAALEFAFRGWPIASDSAFQWPVHCYGMVGVGRNLSPDTGSGAELYTVIGHAPRHLDRNIALVGRVIEGIEHLSSLPRGGEALGFYKTAEERTPILRIRLATDLPAAEQPRFEYLSTDSDAFARYAEARANRRDVFFNVPAGGADICNIPVPVRRVE